MASGTDGGCGLVYELSPPVGGGGVWTPAATYAFGGWPSDGCESYAPLTVGSAEFTAGGSGNCEFLIGCGAVFELTPPAAGRKRSSLPATNGDGAFPVTGVVLGKNGVLYGTTGSGGAISGSPCSLVGVTTGCGTVYELTPPASPGGLWTETILHSFTGQNGDGAIPGPLTVGPDGVLYGPTSSGGSAGHGTVFALVP